MKILSLATNPFLFLIMRFVLLFDAFINSKQPVELSNPLYGWTIYKYSCIIMHI